MKNKIGITKIIIALCFITFVGTSCYYDNEEVLYPSLGGACDTTNVTYSGTIADIMANNCNSCHGATYKSDGDGIRLDNYSNLKSKLDDVIAAINHSSTKSAMPKNSAKLNDCKLIQFDIWNKAGAPNN